MIKMYLPERVIPPNEKLRYHIKFSQRVAKPAASVGYDHIQFIAIVCF